MNIEDFNEISAQEKALQKAKEKFFKQYEVDNDSFKSRLYIDNTTGQLSLEIVPKKTNHKEPFYVVGEDIKTLYNLVSMLFNASELKKDADAFKKKEFKKIN